MKKILNIIILSTSLLFSNVYAQKVEPVPLPIQIVPEPTPVPAPKPAVTPVVATVKDSWTGPDKVKHFGVSVALGIAATNLTTNKTTAFALSVAPGLAKELYDSRQPGNKFSYKDLAWDAIGAYVGIHAGFYLHKLPGGGMSVGYNTNF